MFSVFFVMDPIRFILSVVSNDIAMYNYINIIVIFFFHILNYKFSICLSSVHIFHKLAENNFYLSVFMYF